MKTLFERVVLCTVNYNAQISIIVTIILIVLQYKVMILVDFKKYKYIYIYVLTLFYICLIHYSSFKICSLLKKEPYSVNICIMLKNGFSAVQHILNGHLVCFFFLNLQLTNIAKDDYI